MVAAMCKGGHGGQNKAWAEVNILVIEYLGLVFRCRVRVWGVGIVNRLYVPVFGGFAARI